MSEHDLLALREAVSAPGASSVQLGPEIVVWMIDEIFRYQSLTAGLHTALEDALVGEFAARIELSTSPASTPEEA